MGDLLDQRIGFLLTMLVLVGLFLVSKYVRKRPIIALDSIAWFCLIGYISAVVAVTMFPLPVSQSEIDFGRSLAADGYGQTNNYELFRLIRDTSEWNFGVQVVGNFILLVPLGVFIAILGLFRSYVARIGAVVLFALAIELSQLAVSQAFGFVYKSFDVDDLWLNSVGGLVGLGLGELITKFAVPNARSHVRSRVPPAANA